MKDIKLYLEGRTVDEITVKDIKTNKKVDVVYYCYDKESLDKVSKQYEHVGKYWIDKGSDEIVCFRAPMLNDANIRKMKLNKDEDVTYWYQYITTALIYNAWDSACEAMCGADKDR